jgi:hypothetical protein
MNDIRLSEQAVGVKRPFNSRLTEIDRSSTMLHGLLTLFGSAQRWWLPTKDLDAIPASRAAAAGVDLFITNDARLYGKHEEGIGVHRAAGAGATWSKRASALSLEIAVYYDGDDE